MGCFGPPPVSPSLPQTKWNEAELLSRTSNRMCRQCSNCSIPMSHRNVQPHVSIKWQRTLMGCADPPE